MDKNEARNRASMTHHQYHQVCLYLGRLAVMNYIDSPISVISEVSKVATGVHVTEKQLRTMLTELGYAYQDGKAETLVLQHQEIIASLSAQVQTLTRMVGILADKDNDTDKPPF